MIEVPLVVSNLDLADYCRLGQSTMTTNLSSFWGLDPSVAYLNHGSFGGCPSAVLQAQTALRLEMERELVDFLDLTLPARLDAARHTLATFLSAEAADLVFVPNATTGVNAVLRSLEFEPGDELLVNDHTYAACKKTIDFVAARSGARVVVAHIPFPLRNEEEVITSVLGVTTKTWFSPWLEMVSWEALAFTTLPEISSGWTWSPWAWAAPASASPPAPAASHIIDFIICVLSPR